VAPLRYDLGTIVLNKSITGIHIGKVPNGYKVFVPQHKKAYVSMDVIFKESEGYKFNEQVETNYVYVFGNNTDVPQSTDSKIVELNEDETKNDQTKRVQPSRQAKDRIVSYQEDEEKDGYQSANENPQTPLMSEELLNEEPSSVEEAFHSAEKERWFDALKKEYQALHDNGTFAVSALTSGRKALPCRIVFKRKTDVNGKIDRYKCRAVVKGYAQEEGKDYFELFSPVVKEVTMRILLALGTNFNWHIHHIDIKTAFLNGKLDEEIYMTVPPKYFEILQIDTPPKHHVLKLVKSLYGLKQAC
jgi:hypothetical protein